MPHEFQRVAIVNRGEAAMRFIHAAREFNQEHGTALRTIALFTEPDRHAMFVREADEAVSLGPAQIVDPATRQLQEQLCRLRHAWNARWSPPAPTRSGWDGALWPSMPQFADLCREMGIVFIGPDGDVMRRWATRSLPSNWRSRRKIPVAPWSGGPVETLDDARHHAERLGYPLLIKATAGGGGHGIRRVHSASELATSLRERPRRGLQGLWRSHRFHGAADYRRTSCRGPDHRRPSRNHVGGRSARLHASSAATRRCWKRRRRRRCRPEQDQALRETASA